jgi:hypothetical protein
MNPDPTTVAEVSALCEALVGTPQGNARTDLLIRLLVREGHDRHEDIVFELGLLGEAKAVPAIAEAVAIPFSNLVEWDNLHEFQRKCAYALARIGTSESRAVLEQLAASEDPHLKEYGLEGLSHWPLK